HALPPRRLDAAADEAGRDRADPRGDRATRTRRALRRARLPGTLDRRLTHELAELAAMAEAVVDRHHVDVVGRVRDSLRRHQRPGEPRGVAEDVAPFQREAGVVAEPTDQLARRLLEARAALQEGQRGVAARVAGLRRLALARHRAAGQVV